MRVKLIGIVMLSAALLLNTTCVFADAPIQAKVAMTDSSAASLAGTKRVAISNVLVSFQASTSDRTSTSGMFAMKSDASSLLQMPEMDSALLVKISNEIYAQLVTDLISAGFEVVPEATVLASPNYQKIIAMAGFSSPAKYGNIDGDAMLVGPSRLKPYLSFSPETGQFMVPTGGKIKDWMTGYSGASSTAGGPNATSTYYSSGLPGLEVDLAKELNAHIVKATYIVTLGTAKAGTSGRFSSWNNYSSEVSAQLGLLAGQTRIAFRSPNGKTKGQSISKFKPVPAKDGDVVVSLAEPLLGGTGFFTLQGGEEKGGIAKFLGVRPGADVQFAYTASISEPAAYSAELLGMVKVAQHDMLVLVKP